MRPRRWILIPAAAAALALGGTAIANPGGVFGGGPEEREQELARDLAKKLDGVTAREVEDALGEIRREHRAEHRREHARALAAELDVSADRVEDALAKAERQARAAFRRGERPRRTFAATLAAELDKSVSEVRSAFRSAHRKEHERRLDQAVRDGRISEAQARELRERFEDGPRRGGRFHAPHHGRGGPGGPHPHMGGPLGPPPGP